MNILHICDWYHPIGGAEKLMFDTLDLLEEGGHTNIVVYNEHPHQKPTGKRLEYPCRYLEFWVYFHMSHILARKAIGPIKRIIEEHRPDVCHIHNLQNAYVTDFLTKTIPCVRSIHDPRLYCFTNWRLLPDNSVCPYPLGSECIHQGCISSSLSSQNNVDRNASWVLKNFKIHKKMPILIGESRAQIDCMLQNGFVPEQIGWLPNFTPLRPVHEVREYLKQHFKPEEKIVLFVGRASLEKGINVLMDACEHIKSDCKVVFITAGPLLEEVQVRAKCFGTKVEVIPGLSYEETRKYYARASVVVVPSTWLESFCLIGPETFANMKPVIGSRIGGILDWLKEGETGWFFEPGNSLDLAQKIDDALSDPERLRTMGEAAYERVKTYYNPETYLARLVDIYQRGIQRFRKSASWKPVPLAHWGDKLKISHSRAKISKGPVEKRKFPVYLDDTLKAVHSSLRFLVVKIQLLTKRNSKQDPPYSEDSSYL
jgi:glycosyltransferase involved in cell wall biosynthesis